MAPEKFSKTSFDDEHGSYLKVMREEVMVTSGGLGAIESMERKAKGDIL